MREIKFRGKGQDGKFYYGDLIHYKDGRTEIYTEIDAQIVDPETVAQFVGYDSSGKEVYEGDILIFPNGKESAPVGLCFEVSNIAFPFGYKVGYKLKGETEP